MAPMVPPQAAVGAGTKWARARGRTNSVIAAFRPRRRTKDGAAIETLALGIKAPPSPLAKASPGTAEAGDEHDGDEQPAGGGGGAGAGWLDGLV